MDEEAKAHNSIPTELMKRYRRTDSYSHPSIMEVVEEVKEDKCLKVTFHCHPLK